MSAAFHSIQHTRKFARDNTVHYQWRVLHLLPGAERPSYTGLQVEVLERADGELMIKYQGDTVEFQAGHPPASALWGEGTGRSSIPEKSEAADDQTGSHLDETQRKLLADLESSVGKRAQTKAAAYKGKPIRHQLHRTPAATQQARWEAVHQAKSRGTVPACHCQRIGHVTSGHQKICPGRESPYQAAQRQGAGQGRGPGPGPITDGRRLIWVTYSLFKTGDGIAGQQQIDTNNAQTPPQGTS